MHPPEIQNENSERSKREGGREGLGTNLSIRVSTYGENSARSHCFGISQSVFGRIQQDLCSHPVVFYCSGMSGWVARQNLVRLGRAFNFAFLVAHCSAISSIIARRIRSSIQPAWSHAQTQHVRRIRRGCRDAHVVASWVHAARIWFASRLHPPCIHLRLPRALADAHRPHAYSAPRRHFVAHTTGVGA